MSASPAATPTGTGFGLGGATGAGGAKPSEADLAELQKLLGKR